MELKAGRDIKDQHLEYRAHVVNRGQWDQTTQVTKDHRVQEETRVRRDIKPPPALLQGRRAHRAIKVHLQVLFQQLLIMAHRGS
jgi:hypothetical protein